MPPKKGGVKKKSASGYKMPDHLPEGTTLTDLKKKTWTLGKSIGIGGFGEIYLAGEGQSIPKGDAAKYVVKIEPKENGPLFVEMHFYIQVGSPDQISGWKGPVNMPLLRGQGSHKHKDDIYRFLVIDRFGVDLDKTFQNGKQPLSDDVIGTLAVQIINTLEYIHSKGYTHNDVKAANLLSGLGKDSSNIYLVDFGLCVKYMKPDGHKEYKADPRKAHDGTIEYLSRDAHIGCTSRRSDLEVLCYNLYHWKTGSLPWIKSLDNPVKVQGEKEKFMSGLPTNLNSLPTSIQQLFKYVNSLKFEEKPDYNKCRAMFKSETLRTGGRLSLSSMAVSRAPVRSPQKAKSNPKPNAAAARGRKKPAKSMAESSEEDDDLYSPTPPKKTLGTPRGARGRSGTPRGKTASRGTPRSKPRVASVASMASASESEEEVPSRSNPKKVVKKFSEAGCQTSPGFVAKAAAAKRAARAAAEAGAAAISNGVDEITNGHSGGAEEDEADRSAKRSAAAKKAPKKTSASRSTPKRKSRQAEDDGGAAGMDNPTPAMLEILKRKQQAGDGKSAKKLRK